MSSCQCWLIARVREDALNCDNHNYTVKNTCQHYYLGCKNGYTTALQVVGELVAWQLGKCNQLGECNDGSSTAIVLKKLIDWIDNEGTRL